MKSVFGNCELLHVGRVNAPRGWHLGPQIHDHHELVVLLSGATRAALAGHVSRIAEGEALVFPRGVVHEEWAGAEAGGFQSLYVGFTWGGLPSSMAGRLADRDGRLRQLVRWLHMERESDHPEIRMARAGYFRALLGELARLSGDELYPIVEQVRSFVRRHLAQPLRVEDLAAEAGLSKYHFIRTYRDAAGRTPMAEVRALRLARARDLILTTRLPLKQIADLCGLGDAAHFSRVFRQQLGVAPSSLRTSWTPRGEPRE